MWVGRGSRGNYSPFYLIEELAAAAAQEVRAARTYQILQVIFDAVAQERICALARCAPPSGSGTTSSMMPSFSKSSEVRAFAAVLAACSRAAPQDRRATFRRDDGINRMLKHQHAVASGTAIAPPELLSPITVAISGMGIEVAVSTRLGDGFRLAARFGVNTGKSAWYRPA